MSVLRLTDVKKYFGGVKALDGVSLTINHGDLLMIIGPNGAGKTTLVNTISGYVIPDNGKIEFMGQDITRLNPLERVKRGIVRSFQHVTIFDNLTVLENILAALVSKKRYFNKFFKILDDFEDLLSEAEKILKVFGLEEKMEALPTDISYGDRKLLDVAIAFALSPALIMMDEPTSGVATKDKDVIMQRILEIIKKSGVTAIIIEHDMDIVFRYGERIIVMHEGKVMADGRPEEIKMNEEVKRVLLGEIHA